MVETKRLSTCMILNCSLAAPPLRIIVEGSGVSSIKQLYQWNLNYVTFSRVNW